MNKNHIKMLPSVCFLALLTSLCSCQESMQEKAQRQAKEYTRKYCPTPPINYISTDSLAFDIGKNTFMYYMTFSETLDSKEVIDLNREKLYDLLTKSVRESTQMKPYIQAGCHFHYVCRSKKNPKTVLLEVKF